LGEKGKSGGKRGGKGKVCRIERGPFLGSLGKKKEKKRKLGGMRTRGRGGEEEVKIDFYQERED